MYRLPVLLLLNCSLFLGIEAWLWGRPDPGLMTRGGIWPLPRNQTDFGAERFAIDPDMFVFNSWHSGCEIIDKALSRYKRLAFPTHFEGKTKGHEVPKNADVINAVTVSSKAGCSTEYPQLEMDESYTIQAAPGSNQALILANTVWGVLRGLDSFSQLIYKDSNGTWWLKATVINDKPRFPHRGIMLDTARHYLSINIIKLQIEIMAQNKMNVLHWHFVDSESFPYTSARYPNMSLKGAYTPKHVYTPIQISDVIEFARFRGIRVIPEFDTPGHMEAWGPGMTGLLSDCFDENGTAVPDPNMIDPTKAENWEFLAGFFEEAIDLFKDHHFHFGGDEVDYWTDNCWLNNPHVKKFMDEHGFTDTMQLLGFYFKKIEKTVRELKNSKKTKMIFWQWAKCRESRLQGTGPSCPPAGT